MADPARIHSDSSSPSTPAAKRCEVCDQQTHAKWHELARGGINPVALIEFVESLERYSPFVAASIIGWVYAVTAMDIPAFRAMVDAERKAEKVGQL